MKFDPSGFTKPEKINPWGLSTTTTSRRPSGENRGPSATDDTSILSSLPSVFDVNTCVPSGLNRP
jgi:hypothetical protein